MVKDIVGLDACVTACVHPEKVELVQANALGEPDLDRVAAMFKLLGDPTRAKMLYALLEAGELCVCDLAAVLGMTQSAVSHQLRTLRDLRLVKSRRTGREIFYTLDDDHIRQLFRLGLNHIQHR